MAFMYAWTHIPKDAMYKIRWNDIVHVIVYHMPAHIQQHRWSVSICLEMVVVVAVMLIWLYVHEFSSTLLYLWIENGRKGPIDWHWALVKTEKYDSDKCYCVSVISNTYVFHDFHFDHHPACMVAQCLQFWPSSWQSGRKYNQNSKSRK